jgi:hypothetical protein
MSTPTERTTNERVELTRYTIATGERVIYRQRVLGVVRLLDLPADGHGRRYVIERGVSVRAELEAIVEDYLDQADRWQVIPAAGRSFSGSSTTSAGRLRPEALMSASSGRGKVSLVKQPRVPRSHP